MKNFTTMMLVGLLVIMMNQGANSRGDGSCYKKSTHARTLIRCTDCPDCCCEPHGGDKVDCGDRARATDCCSCSKCFPAIAKVQHSDGNMKTIAELLVGHTITTMNSNGDIVPTEVIAFMKQQRNVNGVYKHIKTDRGNEVVMSPDHLILKATQGNSKTFALRYAKEVQVGDLVKIADGEKGVGISKVVEVQMSVLKGAYVPLTKEGTILVDGVLTSTYAAIDHDVAHFFVAPLRWFPELLGTDLNADGSHPYVDLVRDIGKWLMPETLQSKQNKIWNFVAGSLYLDTASD